MQPLPAPTRGQGSSSQGARDQNRQQSLAGPAANQAPPSTLQQTETTTKKKRKHRGGRKRRNRRQSFAAPSEASAVTSLADDPDAPTDPMMQAPVPGSRDTFYRRGTIGNLSEESLESEALLDHRNHQPLRTRRESRVSPSVYPNSHRSGFQPNLRITSPQRANGEQSQQRRRHRSQANRGSYETHSDQDEEVNDRTPLMSIPRSPIGGDYGLSRVRSSNSALSAAAASQNQTRRRGNTTNQTFPNFDSNYNVNNPPSVPGSPNLRAQYDDVMVGEGDYLPRSPDSRRNLQSAGKDAVINIDGNGDSGGPNSAPPSPRRRPEGFQLHRSVTFPGEEDVCFPVDGMSELGDEEYDRLRQVGTRGSVARRRNRRQEWPQLWVLDDWSREEKEQRAGERRSKKINEPVFVDGRLRPAKHAWHRVEEEMPYRYTYFNEEFESTIHAQTISELIQPGGNFRELFNPDPPELSDSSESEEEDLIELHVQSSKHHDTKAKDDQDLMLSPKSQAGPDAGGSQSNIASRLNSIMSNVSKEVPPASTKSSAKTSGQATPQQGDRHPKQPKQKKYGQRPTFWLDVMCPTDQEMRVLCKTFGIHALTSEDIMMQEAREKVELFRHYYFINYRTFEQDTNSEDYLEPINMYVCVFRHGIISFHFSQIPHPANVRRRIRQLSDYLILSADWISYAIIDDITDVYQPLITSIEQEVDDIDELILKALQSTQELSPGDNPDDKDNDTDIGGKSGFDMLRRIGECRKKVMSLYRLLGSKADVIKGFAKRCNEQWEVAPKSEIGLYLGDIQDHILTMTSNLSHYETLLSRAHSNYLAQVSIRMNERQEMTADVLGKLTVVGTIVLPLNVITGLFGMNVKVPGQEIDNLIWFWSLVAGMAVFSIICFWVCSKVYHL